MEPFDQTVCLRAVGCCELFVTSEGGTERRPDGPSELRSSVARDQGRHAEARDPAADKSVHQRCSVDVDDGECFRPPSRLVYCHQQVPEAVADWQGADDVNVDGRERNLWNWNAADRC